MKAKLLTLMLVFSMVITGSASFASVVSAANTADKAYAFSNTNTTGQSAWRTKENTTKVYVYPQSGPKIRYTVYGRTDDNGNATPRSNQVAIPLGVQGSITNTVRENGNNMAQLRFERISYAQVDTKGVWSPDSTRNYTIYN